MSVNKTFANRFALFVELIKLKMCQRVRQHRNKVGMIYHRECDK